MESLMLGAAMLKPEAVPLRVKVVIIGRRAIYDLLFRHDPDFPKIFKVLADFDTVLAQTRGHARDVLSVLRSVTLEEDLRELDRSGMAAMLEEAVRIAEELGVPLRERNSLLLAAGYDLAPLTAPRGRRQQIDVRCPGVSLRE